MSRLICSCTACEPLACCQAFNPRRKLLLHCQRIKLLQLRFVKLFTTTPLKEAMGQDDVLLSQILDLHAGVGCIGARYYLARMHGLKDSPAIGSVGSNWFKGFKVSRMLR